jgi:hypothetical protein
MNPRMKEESEDSPALLDGTSGESRASRYGSKVHIESDDPRLFDSDD